MNKKKSHVIVGISGGVDSAVSAYLLQEAGYQVSAVFMQNWHEETDTQGYCSLQQDQADAVAVCEKLQIPLTMISFADEYWQHVFTYFLEEYRVGRTPNPDILCNKEIKFNAFLNYAKQQGADYIATGHYVRTRTHDTGVQLLKGTDPLKDQSYFLYALSAAQLSQSLFPVGNLPKTTVRAIAKQLQLQNHNKKDSTGICFIGERKFKQFLQDYLPAQPGPIITLDGEQLGQHDGLIFYTIGQRQGLNIGGKDGKLEAPWYVAHKDVVRNTLTVVQGNTHPALYISHLRAVQMHWIEPPPAASFTTYAKIRYRQQEQPCVIEKRDDAYEITFKQAQRAVTPGQSIVFYQGDICLGGGIIA